MKKKALSAKLTVGLVLLIATAGVATVPGPAMTYTSFLTGSQENPPVATSAFSIAVFTFLANDSLLFGYRLNFLHDQSVTGVHIHDGAAGVNGPIILNLRPDAFCFDIGPLTIYYATAAHLRDSLAGMTLTDLREKMNTGDTYLNLHTPENPGGWIRGQMNPVALPST